MTRKKYPTMNDSERKERRSNIFHKRILPLIILTLTVFLLLTSQTANAQNPRTYIPERAFEHRDNLYDAIQRNVPELADPNYVGALIEHESCISLKHSRCWSATSELSNKREYSIGFFQIAKAYNANGSIRMDTLTSMKNNYRTRLKDANWDNLKHRPDLQMDVGTLLIGENYRRYGMAANDFERMAFQDAAYNGGAGWVDRERRACNLAAGCDATKWFGNTDQHCLRSKKPIPAYGNRSICTVSRDHPVDVLKVRLPKYQQQYFNDAYKESRNVTNDKNR